MFRHECKGSMKKLQSVSWLVLLTGAAQLLLVCGQSSPGMFKFHDLCQPVYINCIHAGVYLSLGSTNIITNNTEILITTIGEGAPGDLPLLICHTDLVACCRKSDTIAKTNPTGDWHYPNGIPILVGNKAPPDALFYIQRNKQVVRLHRNESINPQTGSYCCTIPTIAKEMILCANLGE